MILYDPEQSEAVAGFPGLVALGAKLPAKATLSRYLREAQRAVGLKGEVSVLLTTDDGIRGLNRRFRKKNKATDVLSFPADPEIAAGYGVAGDLAVSVEMAARQAAEQGHRLSVELRVLMLHGMLHLAGMDHEADSGEMARKERRLRTKLGLPLGLIERAVLDKPMSRKRDMGHPARTLRTKAGTRGAGRAEFRLRRGWQGLKPVRLARLIGTTEVVPCYKTVSASPDCHFGIEVGVQISNKVEPWQVESRQGQKPADLVGLIGTTEVVPCYKAARSQLLKSDDSVSLRGKKVSL